MRDRSSVPIGGAFRPWAGTVASGYSIEDATSPRRLVDCRLSVRFYSHGSVRPGARGASLGGPIRCRCRRKFRPDTPQYKRLVTFFQSCCVVNAVNLFSIRCRRRSTGDNEGPLPANADDPGNARRSRESSPSSGRSFRGGRPSIRRLDPRPPRVGRQEGGRRSILRRGAATGGGNAGLRPFLRLCASFSFHPGCRPREERTSHRPLEVRHG